ncbi:MAG: hypothetical protein RhofKO_32080 [Rhodothermales bacterium]
MTLVSGGAPVIAANRGLAVRNLAIASETMKRQMSVIIKHLKGLTRARVTERFAHARVSTHRIAECCQSFIGHFEEVAQSLAKDGDCMLGSSRDEQPTLGAPILG